MVQRRNKRLPLGEVGNHRIADEIPGVQEKARAARITPLCRNRTAKNAQAADPLAFQITVPALPRGKMTV